MLDTKRSLGVPDHIEACEGMFPLTAYTMQLRDIIPNFHTYSSDPTAYPDSLVLYGPDRVILATIYVSQALAKSFKIG